MKVQSHVFVNGWEIVPRKFFLFRKFVCKLFRHGTWSYDFLYKKVPADTGGLYWKGDGVYGKSKKDAS